MVCGNDGSVFRASGNKLQVGSNTEYVNVTGESTLINTSGAVSNVIDRQLIDDLPLDGRSIQSLISLSPGVQTVPVDSTEDNQANSASTACAPA